MQPTTPGGDRVVSFGDGSFRVPEQVAPGTYRTLRAATECYWTRLSGFTGGLTDLITSRISAGYEVATIEATDAGFDSVGCGEWTADLRAVTQTRVQFGEGTYIVGTDFEPGTYVSRAVGEAGCEWARLSGFAGTDEEIIDGGVAVRDQQARITIQPTDVGFTSAGCSTWRVDT